MSEIPFDITKFLGSKITMKELNLIFDTPTPIIYNDIETFLAKPVSEAYQRNQDLKKKYDKVFTDKKLNLLRDVALVQRLAENTINDEI